jgi:hypothetical protein
MRLTRASAALGAALWLGACVEEPDADSSAPDAAAEPSDVADAAAAPLDAGGADAGSGPMTRDAASPPDPAVMFRDAAAPPAPPEPDPGPPLSSDGPYDPMARMSAASIPRTTSRARESGCVLVGRRVGTGAANAITLLGGFGQFLSPDPDGNVALVLLLQAAGWAAGSSALDVEAIELRFFVGEQLEPGAFAISRDAFVDGDPARGPATAFPSMPVEEGWFQSSPIPFQMPLPLGEGSFVPMQLVGTRIIGHLSTQGVGMTISDGLLLGYWTESSMLDLLAGVQTACASGMPPSLCTLIGGQLSPDRDLREVLDLIVGVVGGFDVHWDGSAPAECGEDDGPTCNALGVCLVIETEPVVVRDIAD